MPRKLKNVWLSRDFHKDSTYDLWRGKPIISLWESTDWVEGDSSLMIEQFCPFDFEKVTGLRLKPGDCFKVEIDIRVVSK